MDPNPPTDTPPAVAGKPPVSRLAQASWRCGWMGWLGVLVFSFLCMGAPFLPTFALVLATGAVGLGIAAWVSLLRSGGRLRGRGPASVGILLGIPLLILSVWAIIFPPTYKFDLLEAEQTARSLKNAIAAYRSEYRQWPHEGAGRGDFDLQSDEDLMDVLLGANSEAGPGGRNPRKIVFFASREARPRGERFAKGITLNRGGGGALWDPWGNHYRVRIDADGDKRVEDPANPGRFIQESVIVWSAGRDGNFETWRNNVKSWEDP